MPNTQKYIPEEMNPKIIKSEAEHSECLREIERLISLDPAAGSTDGERLELLSLLVETYEKNQFPFDRPDPIEAIQFRMQEQGLTQADVVPYFGSRSRVSEVLNRKRPLTVQMIRDVSAGLGIPAEILISSPVEKVVEEPQLSDLEWGKLPAKEMKQRGYFSGLDVSGGKKLVDLAKEFYLSVLAPGASAGVLTRRAMRGDAVSPKSRYRLMAWHAKVLAEARRRKRQTVSGTYKAESLGPDFLKQVAQLSWHRNGPRMARELIEGAGIAVVIEPQFKGTQLDGAAFLDRDGSPVIGLTLRLDRIDNFWFTLEHELVHVIKHLSQPNDQIFDRLADNHETTEALEKEANRLARDALIPRATWKRSGIVSAPSYEKIIGLADELKIHPAIVAGRIQRETGNFGMFAQLVGWHEVKGLFPEINFD